MSLRILYSFPVRVGLTGIGMVAWHQVKGLLEHGVDVHLCCGTLERPIPGLSSLTETMRVGKVRVPYKLFGNLRAFSWHDAAVARILRRSDVDLVHCWPMGAEKTLRTAQHLGVPTLLERPNSHTGFAFDVVEAEHRKIGLPVSPTNTHAFDGRHLQREEEEYRLATQLACPSDFVMNTFLARGFPREQLARHFYGFEPPPATHLMERERYVGRQFTAAFIARCEPRKGLHYALEAWHRSGAAEKGRLFIAGSFVPGYRELLKKWLDHPSVELLGFVKDFLAVMQQSDVFLLPSIEEGSALVTYDARACGCVLAVSDATGAPCEHMREGLVHCAGDIDAFTEHLRLLRTNTELAARLRAESLRGVPALSWNNAVKRLIDVYQGVLKNCASAQTSLASDAGAPAH